MWNFVVLAVACLMVANGHIVKRQAQPCPDECENLPIDISFIVDSSSSIWPQNFTIGLWFINDFLEQFEIGPNKVRVSLVTFGEGVYPQDAIGFEDYTDKESLAKAIDEVPFKAAQKTDTAEGLKYYMENVKPTVRAGVRSVVIVLTDGNSQQPHKTEEEAKKLIEEGLEVFAIGVGYSITPEELHNIASDGEHVFIVSDYNALSDIQHRLTYEACGVKPHPQCSFSPVDVCFVLDSSLSIGQENFTLELTFIKEFLEVFKINPSSARVAAVMFGQGVYSDSAIHFDQFPDEKETLDAIVRLPYMNGQRTDTSDGIDYMIKNFAPHFRSHAAHIGIIITDGKSQNWMGTRKEAAAARKAGITTVAVGVGSIDPHHGSLDQEELEHIAGDPSRVVTADDFAQLNAIRDRLTDITCDGIQNELRALAAGK